MCSDVRVSPAAGGFQVSEVWIINRLHCQWRIVIQSRLKAESRTFECDSCSQRDREYAPMFAYQICPAQPDPSIRYLFDRSGALLLAQNKVIALLCQRRQ